MPDGSSAVPATSTPIDVERATNVLTAALLREMGDGVDAIFRYGSFLRGNPHTYSDLDISYVPAHEETGRSITVLVGQTLCDLYPIRWSELERMARFESVSSSVLLSCRLIYARTPAIAERFGALPDHLEALLRPEARAAMLRRALDTFQQTAYPRALLRQEAVRGHLPGRLQQAQIIVSAVAHCLAMANQRCIDTRKLEEVLSLPRLPDGFQAVLDRLYESWEPAALAAGCDSLLAATRAFLLAEQRALPDGDATFFSAFGPGYPELRSDIQHLMLACDRQDTFALRRCLVSLYHELSRCIAEATTGVRYTAFNALSEYEADLVALGFPPLLPLAQAHDLSALRAACVRFDQHLQRYLQDRGVSLNAFATLDELEEALDAGSVAS